MARTVQECNSYIVSNLVTQFAAVGITINPTNWSKANLLRLICYTVAIAQSLGEQFMDDYITKAEEIQSKSAAGSLKWIQDKMFKFQYSSTNPQTVVYNDGVPGYAEVNETLQIITACAVLSTLPNQVLVKVAKGSPLSILSGAELSAAQSYIDYIGTAGIVYTVSSQNPDRLYLKGEIFYVGSYSAVIADAVIDALDNYLATLSVERFGGDILVSGIKAVILSVEGVNDVQLEEVKCRYSSQSFGTGTTLVTGFDLQQRKYNASAGYLIQEDTATHTFADELTFTAE